MEFQWDERKAISNKRKHGVEFADAVSALEDDAALTVPDKNATEDRFVTIGMDAFGRILVVVYSYRRDDIRIISARTATKQERITYGG